MAYWLVYTRCEDCTESSCLQCRKETRSLTLHVVEANDMPAASLNGPCASPQEILKRMGEHFDFDETGKMIFKVAKHE